MKRKLTHSEAGRLGGLASVASTKRRCRDMREKYYQDPKICKRDSCQIPISFETKNKNKFCSHSCAATYVNNLRGHYRSEEKPCKFCDNLTYRKSGYCSAKCSKAYRRAIKIQQIEQGLVSGRTTLRNYLIEKFGYHCFECDLDKWREKHLPLEIDHIDGNAENNFPVNLRLLCPNCHSITPTWKSKNKGNGRASRGLRLN